MLLAGTFLKLNKLFSLGIMVSLLLVITLGTVLIRGLIERHEAYNFEQLEAIAVLKSGQVKSWLNEHRLKAEMLRVASPLNKILLRLQQGDDNPADIKFLVGRLNSLRELYNYRSVYVIDRIGNIVITSGSEKSHLSKVILDNNFHNNIASDSVFFSPFHHDDDASTKQMHADLIVPFKDADNFALVMELKQDEFIIPSLQSWPIPSDTAETMLLQRDGGSVLILNELRHKSNTAFKRRVPVNKLDKPIVKAINNVLPSDEVFEGTDYRGIPIIGMAMPIVDTPWYMLVKIDQREAFAELYRDIIWASVAIFLALFAVISVAILRRQWKMLQRVTLEQRDLAEASAGENEQQVRDLLNSTAEAIIGVDIKGIISFANRAAIEILGYQDINELIGHEMHQLIHSKHVDGSHYHQDECPMYQTLLSGKHSHIDDEVLWRADDSNFAVEYWAYPILRNGELSGCVVTFVDISERKMMESQLNNLAQIVEQNPNSIVMTNLDAEIEYVNDAFTKISGFSREEVMGQNPCILKSGNTKNETYDSMWKALNNGKNWEGELYNKKKDGTEFVEFVNISPIYESDRSFRHFVAIKEDITEKKQLGDELDKHRHHLEELVSERTEALEEQTDVAEQLRAESEVVIEQNLHYLHRIEQSEEKFRNLVEASSDFIWEVDQNGLYTYVTPTVEYLLGYKAEEMIGKSPFDFMPDFERERVGAIFTNYVTNKKPFKNLENVNFHKDGAQVMLSTSGVPFFDEAGELKGYRGVDRDITEKKIKEIELQESKEQLILALDSANLGLWDWRPQSDTLNTNDIFLTMLGYEPDAFPQKMERWTNLVHPDDIDATIEILQPFLDGDDGKYNFEYRMRAANDKWKWILDVGRVVERDNEGRAIRFVGIHIDITKLKKAEKLAEAANQSKSDFLANMSHEIRTPMNAVLGLTYLLGETHLDDKQRDFINKISNSGKTLLSIINDILDFSKIEAGHMELDHQIFSLSQLVDNVSNLIAPHMSANKTEMEVKPLPEGINFIQGDSLHLQQILINFLSNAAKFSKHGKVCLEVTQTEEQHGKESKWINLRFSVKDTGIGILEEKLSDIFKAFTQEDISTTRKYGGTGLGLTICSRLANLMNGQIGVNSEVGKGSKFWVDLPFELVSDNELIEDISHQETTGERIANRHILVVDDSEINREVVKNILELHDAVVSLANDGEQAIKLIQENTNEIEIVLMDVQMPVMDGLQATRIIRQELELDLPIIALSAGAFKEQERISLAAGMNDFLAKPIDVPQLLKTIHQWLPLSSDKIDNVRLNKAKSEQSSSSSLKPMNLKLSGLDVSAGLKNWQVEESYQKFLGKFVDTYSQSNSQIADYINANKYDEASFITHKLKGVAGNLGMPELSRLAGELDQVLNNGKEDQDLREVVDRISNELQQALNSIAQYLAVQTPHIQKAQQEGRIIKDSEKLTAQLQDLLIALEADNPNDVKPLLTTLEQELGIKRIHSIVAAVDEFDFYQAKIETKKLLDNIKR